LKTLYIHGCDSFPVPEKIQILRNAGLEVTAPHIDYRIQPDLYQFLKETIISENLEFLIGSSLGGFTAFWLAEDLGLPCLLFNPAMSFGDLFKKQLPEISNRLCPARFVVIGAKDETVDPTINKAFFESIETKSCLQRVIVCQWLGHQIDFTTFEEMVGWALMSYENFRKMG
jgi:hypothetical protein